MKLLLLSMMYMCACCVYAQTPTTVDTVDLNRYSGLWYEIARYPQWFEKNMTHVTAEYIVNEDYVRVINRGLRSGKHKMSKAKAFVVKNSGNARLRVQFFWPFRADYWIIDLDPAYQWAVVSNSKKSTLWILSRTPLLPKETLDTILRNLSFRGFDLSKLELTDQSPL